VDEYGDEGFGMFIYSNLAGAYNGTPSFVDPVYQDNMSYVFSPTLFAPGPLTLPTIFGADPVNMLDGSYSLDHVDLAAGQPEPRGYSFSRHYDTNRRGFNQANMANGWTQ
jgi:hypothetical protein